LTSNTAESFRKARETSELNHDIKVINKQFETVHYNIQSVKMEVEKVKRRFENLHVEFSSFRNSTSSYDHSKDKLLMAELNKMNTDLRKKLDEMDRQLDYNTNVMNKTISELQEQVAAEHYIVSAVTTMTAYDPFETNPVVDEEKPLEVGIVVKLFGENRQFADNIWQRSIGHGWVRIQYNKESCVTKGQWVSESK